MNTSLVLNFEEIHGCESESCKAIPSKISDFGQSIVFRLWHGGRGVDDVRIAYRRESKHFLCQDLELGRGAPAEYGQSGEYPSTLSGSVAQLGP